MIALTIYCYFFMRKYEKKVKKAKREAARLTATASGAEGDTTDAAANKKAPFIIYKPSYKRKHEDSIHL